MIRIIKDETPEFWTNFLVHHKKVKHYDDLKKSDDGKELRRNIRLHMIMQQKYICCYCCGEIDIDKSHNEHIKPRDKKPALSLDYNNLLASCNGKNQCGKAKDKKYSENSFVSPLDADVENQFEYTTDGEIIGLNDEARYTVELLGLNSYILTCSRKKYMMNVFRW